MLVSRTGLSPVMAGRDDELAELRRVIEEAERAGAGAAPTIVMVSGEAGVGKSRLLRELLSSLAGDLRVFCGQAEEGDLGRPFELLRDLVESEVAGWDDVPEALARRRPILRRVLAPLLPDPGDDGGEGLATDELLQAGLELMAHLVGGRRSVLVFEDLHWADAESVALFGRLASSDLPVTLLGSFRLEDFDRRHPLAALLPALERQRSVRHLELGRLSRDALGVMLESIYCCGVSSHAVETLHRRTQGNPFFVEELVASAEVTGPEELASAPLPWNAAEAVLRRLDSLDAETRQVADAAAVLGARIPFDLLAAVSGVDEARLIPALRTLVERGILVESEADVFSFRHALTREAVAGALLGRERRRLHELAYAELVAAASDDDASLARHACGAHRYDALVEHARQGAVRAMREGSPLQALHLSEQGLAEAPDDLVMLSVAASAAWAVGMTEDAERHAEAWRTGAIVAGDVAAESAALRTLATCRWFASDAAGYAARLGEALARAETLGPSEELAWCLAYHSQAFMLTDRPAEAIEWADRAIDMADDLGLPAVRAHALVNKGTAMLDLAGRDEEALALLEAGGAEAMACHDVLTAARAANNAAMFVLWHRPPAEARVLVERSRRLVDDHGVDVLAAKSAAHALMLAVIEGDADSAAAWVRTGRRFHTDVVEQVVFAAEQAELLLEGDDVAGAGALLEAYAPSAEKAPSGRDTAWFRMAEVAHAARRGAPETAAALGRMLTALEPIVGDVPLEPPATAVFHALAAGVAVDEVAAFWSVARDRNDDPTGRWGRWIDHAEGALAEAAGDVESAVARYRRAVAVEVPPRPAYWVAETHHALTRLLLGTGDRDGARHHADRALDLLARWPGWRRDRVAALRRRLGHDGSDDGRILTAREREVLTLVSRGLTNRQIAEQLYISTKTAAVHVSNILAKTGTASRTEAASWALQSGALDGEASAG